MQHSAVEFEPHSRPWRSKWGSFYGLLVSFIAHSGLLLVLALIGLVTPHLSSPTITASIVDNSAGTVDFALDSGNPTSGSPASDTEEVEIAITQPNLEFNPTTQDIDNAVLGTATPSSRTTSTLLASAFSTGGSGGGSHEEESTKDMENPGKPGQASFFGAKAYGTKFVYVIDASTSMDGYRWNRAVGELIKSINNLSDGTEFFVIAFHLTAIPIDESLLAQKRFLVKDKTSSVKVRKFVRSLKLGRGTLPALAMQFALQMEPDSIFLLSDGELMDNTRFLLKNTNHTDTGVRIPISTVHLFSPSGMETLKAIAEENGGEFAHIKGRD